MKILMVNAVNGMLSTGRFCSDLCDYLAAKGHIGRIAFSTGKHTENAIRLSTTIESKYHALMSRITGKQGYHSLFATKKIICYIEEYKPDIVQLDNLHSNYINVIQLLEFLSKKNIATVVVLHDCWFYTGKCTHYTSINCIKWKTGCYECPKLQDDHISWFFDKTQNMWNQKKEAFSGISKLAVVGVSEWITKEAEQSFLKNANVIKKIHNGIDVVAFHQKDANDLKHRMKLDNCKVILGVAYTWSNKKGLDKFIEVSTRLPENQKIVLVGKMGYNIELPKNIISVPLTNDIDKLVNYYNMADVFMQLSEEESFGKVVAEALACGTPVITNSGTANPELVDESCGIVLESLTAESILEAINKIFAHGKQYYSIQCINHAKENFDKELCFEKYLELYKELLNYD